MADALAWLGLAGLRWGPPDDAACNALLRSAGGVNHGSVATPGAVGEKGPPGFVSDYYAARVGSGARDYDAAVAAVRAWAHADALPWVRTNRVGQRRGARAVIAAAALGPVGPVPLWSANPLAVTAAGAARGAPAFARGAPRVSARPPRDAPGRTYAVTLTTLAPHTLAGAETFAVHEVAGTGEVWYAVASFSRPATLVSLLTYPLVRGLQAAFRAGSAAAVEAEVGKRRQERGGR
jgi:uncharacterized protein (UPF0548 family)